MAVQSSGSLGTRFPLNLLGSKLPDGGRPRFNMVGLNNLTVFNGMDIDSHNIEALARWGFYAKKGTNGSACRSATDNESIPVLENFLGFPGKVWDHLPKDAQGLD